MPCLTTVLTFPVRAALPCQVPGRHRGGTSALPKKVRVAGGSAHCGCPHGGGRWPWETSGKNQPSEAVEEDNTGWGRPMSWA